MKALAQFAVCLALLVVCYARTAEGTRHPSAWGYRGWSFGALTYSDILALHEDRDAARHEIPYLHDKIEYPVLLGLGMWLPSVLAPNRAGYFALTFALLALSALGTLLLLQRLPGASAWAWAASPALLVYGALNWDLLGILPLLLGVWLWTRGRERAAVVSLSIAVWTKFFPLLVLGVLLVVATRRSWKHALQLFGIFLAVTLAVNLPVALAAPANWAWFFQYNRIRELEPSLYSFLHADTATANLVSGLVVLAFASALSLYELRTRRLAPIAAACALVCLFFAVNKVYSPQYWLWVVALTAAAGLPAWLLASAGCVSLVDFAVSFSRLHFQMARDPQAGWYDAHLFWPMVGLRYATLFACAACALFLSRKKIAL